MGELTKEKPDWMPEIVADPSCPEDAIYFMPTEIYQEMKHLQDRMPFVFRSEVRAFEDHVKERAKEIGVIKHVKN